MAFARRVLADDEELLAELRTHPVALAAPLVLLCAAAGGAVAIAVELPRAPVAVVWLLGAMVLLPALWCLARFVRWRSRRVLVTSHRIVVRRGVLSRSVVQLRLQRVSEVHAAQTFGERLIGKGRLLFEVPGDDVLVVEDVRKPRRVQRLVAARLDELAHWDEGATADPTPAWERGLEQLAAPRDGRGAAHGPAIPEPQRVPLPAPWDDVTPPQGIEMASASSPRAVSVAEPASVPESPSVADQLVQLDALRRRGIITDAEFDAKKAELLSRI